MKNGGGHPHPLNMDGKKLDPATRIWLETRLKDLKENEAKQKAAELKSFHKQETERLEKAAIQAAIKKKQGYNSLADALKDIKQETKK